MSDNKKYYYLKLKDDFFDSDAMVVLESMPDGYKYSNILLKLYLRSLKNEGKLMFNDRIPYNSTILSQVTRHSVGDVERAIQVFKELDLIEILDNGAIFILDIQNFIGQSSTEADRIRAYRTRIKEEKKQLRLGSTNAVTNVQQMNDKSTPEIDIEIERELEIDKESMSSSDEPDSTPYKAVVDYLNEKTGSKYRSSTQATQRLIKARFNEGFDLEDFKQVIDNKASDWFNDKKMAEYLRPQTLFGTKFESYLNQITTNGGGGYDTSEYDDLF